MEPHDSMKTYHDGQRVAKPPLRAWKHSGTQALQKEKLAFIVQRLPLAMAKFTLIHRNWVMSMWAMLNEVINTYTSYEGHLAVPAYAESTPPFDYETLGGHVSFDKFAEILNQKFHK